MGAVSLVSTSVMKSESTAIVKHIINFNAARNTVTIEKYFSLFAQTAERAKYGLHAIHTTTLYYVQYKMVS
jgi:hypothetical protein